MSLEEREYKGWYYYCRDNGTCEIHFPMKEGRRGFLGTEEQIKTIIDLLEIGEKLGMLPEDFGLYPNRLN